MADRFGPTYGAGTHAVGNESSHSAVSWAAIVAGALTSLAAMLLLLALAGGVGLTIVSPWPNAGASVATFSIVTGIGLIVAQWVSSGLGGFVAGRLRTKWVGVHDHEVFFRDTAHGLLTWALATLVGTVLLSSAVTSAVGGGVRASASVVGGAVQAAGQVASQAASSAVSGYDVDALFRSDRPDAGASAQEIAGQASRILTNAVSTGDLPPADRTYLAQLVSARTGVAQADAEKRVDEVAGRVKAAETKARQAANAARRATAQAAIFGCLSLLIGAFIASVTAALGGRWRDEYY